MSKMRQIAIVTPWFGKDLKGGAEQQAWQVATRLAQRGHNVEVLTTCCRSFQDDWSKNYFRSGVSWEAGIKIRRFRVDECDHARFHQVNTLLLSFPLSQLYPGVSPASPVDADIFCSENINSRQMLRYLKKHHEYYHAFLFIPYLYGVILNGLPLVSSRAFLQPCLHNEVYAYLPQVAKIFHAAKGLLFISEGEAQLAQQLYGSGILLKSTVPGAGIEAISKNQIAVREIKNFLAGQERFVLCLGRRDVTKNTDLLMSAYAAFKQEYPNSDLKLVLVGPGKLPLEHATPGLVDLGLVEEAEKAALLAHCLALFQPSQNESYSRVMMEAWFYGRPVAAHRNCLATAIAVESAQGGWLAETLQEWTALFAQIDQIKVEELAKYGAFGQTYAQANAVWDNVIERYEVALQLTQPNRSFKANEFPRKLKEIHQLLPNLAYGDAISNHALAIRNYLRQCGYRSDIFVRYLDERIVHEAKLFEPNCLNSHAGLIYHHSIGSELTPYAVAHPNAKCLIYHNITPADFFLPYRADFAKILEAGRAELHRLAIHFPISVGDSAYNADELAVCDFPQPGVLPILIHPCKWDKPADAELMQQLQDGKHNLLFVGRFAPNKRQDHLVEAFSHYLTMDRNARLILAGFQDTSDPYYHHVMHRIKTLNLSNDVFVPGQVNDAQLLAFYRTAHLFWSMSEHEGFCVPIVESMWFDIPVLAYKSSAVPETLGKGGLMFKAKDDFLAIAALATLLVNDQELRATVIRAQRHRRNEFLPEIVHQKLDNVILKMEALAK